MKLFQILFTVVWLPMTSQSHAGPWEDLKPYVVTDETPIVFSPDNSTLVLEDPTGSITFEEALARKDEFKPPKEMGPIDARKHYWIMQKVSSRLTSDRNYRLEGNWLSIHTFVIRSDDSILALKTAGFFTGKYSFLSDIDPALPSSAKVASRDALFMLHSGETLSLLSRAKAVHAMPPRSYVLQFVDNERFLETRRYGLYIEGALLGILFALAIFGWYSHFVNKDRAGLFYGTWISFAFMQIFTLPSQDGSHFTEFIVNANDKYFGAVSFSGLFLFISAYGQIIFYFLFASAYLQISKYHSKTQKLIYLLIAYFLVHMIANIFLVHNIGPQVFYGGNAFLPIVVVVFLYVAALQRYRQGMSVAIFWLLASIPYFVFRLIFVSGLMGLPLRIQLSA